MDWTRREHTNLANYDATSATDPVTQGWVDSTNNQASGYLIADPDANAWQADGTNGRAEWKITPTAQHNAEASANGWTMSWTSRVVSGSYITNYYGNGSKRFLPVIGLNAAGDLVVQLTGGGTHTLVTGTGADEYHDYEMTYNSTTGVASFSFDGNVIESGWAGSASPQNIIAWGNGSTTTDSVANYRKVSFDIAPPQSVELPSLLSDINTSNLTFDGSTQYLDASAELANIAGLSQGTILTSFKATGNTATLFSASNSSEGSSEFALLLSSQGILQVHARENGGWVNSTATSTTYYDNEVHKAALVVDNTGTRIYVDGKLEASSNSTAFISSIEGVDSINIGRNLDNGGGQWYFSGEIFDTKIYDGPMSEYHATTLTARTTEVESYDASLDKTPALQGWEEDQQGAASGTLIQELGAEAWQVNGTGGRAEWKVIPDSETNSAASENGWRMTTVARIVSGSGISSYYADGNKRFMPMLSINARGDLIAQLEGGGIYKLVETTGASDYHTYTVTYDPDTSKATFSFDGTAIDSWSGSPASQNIIAWGNGSIASNGIANYRSVDFEVFESEAELPYFVTDVFVGGGEGANGMSDYRIPSFVQALDGSLLAFAEARPSYADPGQAGEIKISLKRSTDMGRTWLPVQTIAENPLYDYSDPRPVVDQSTGTIFVFYTQWETHCAQNGDCVEPGDPNLLLYRSSTDNGVTWSAEQDVSRDVKDPTWRSINAGPGQAIQLNWQTEVQGNHNQRLIFPAIVRAADSLFYVASIYSDDNGASWSAGHLTPVSGPTEADLVELSDGKLLLSARNDSWSPGSRYHFVSDDGGVTWTATTHDIAISKVDIGMTRFSAVRRGDRADRILLSGPIGNPVGSNRNDLGVWISNDEGQTFGTPHQLTYGFAAYSDILKLHDGTIGIVYEASPSKQIRFVNIDIATLEGL